MIVGIIGMGYVGSSLADLLEGKVEKVLKYDTDPTLMKNFIDEFSTADVVLICVPTPLGRHMEPDLSCVRVAVASLVPYVKRNALVILESTTYPGTTREILVPALLDASPTTLVAYSPERVDPGNKTSLSSVPKVVGAYDQRSLQEAVKFYSLIFTDVITVSSLEVAEATKILENVYRCVNIALVNELKMLFTVMGIDIWEVIKAASTKPYGFEAFYPGPGMGGHCIPVDPFYLSWAAKSYDRTTRFIELAGEINQDVTRWVVARIEYALGSCHKQPLIGSRILILGLAYKRNVADDRESPAYKIASELDSRGADITVHDPFITTHDYTSLPRDYFDNTDFVLSQYDAVVLVTDHSCYDRQTILKSSRLVVDTRGIFPKNDRVVKA